MAAEDLGMDSALISDYKIVFPEGDSIHYDMETSTIEFGKYALKLSDKDIREGLVMAISYMIISDQYREKLDAAYAAANEFHKEIDAREYKPEEVFPALKDNAPSDENLTLANLTYKIGEEAENFAKTARSKYGGFVSKIAEHCSSTGIPR